MIAMPITNRTVRKERAEPPQFFFWHFHRGNLLGLLPYRKCSKKAEQIAKNLSRCVLPPLYSTLVSRAKLAINFFLFPVQKQFPATHRSPIGTALTTSPLPKVLCCTISPVLKAFPPRTGGVTCPKCMAAVADFSDLRLGHRHPHAGIRFFNPGPGSYRLSQRGFPG